MYRSTQLARVSYRTQRSLGSGLTTGVSYAGTGLSVASKLAPALMTNPVTMIAGAALSVLGLIAGIFGQHAAAVAREANDLNSAVPAFVKGIQAIMAAANQGQITAAQASSLVDEAVQNYYTAVGSIMKKGGSCPINGQCGGDPQGKIYFNPCNGPCNVGCNYVEPYACMAKRVLQNGGTMSGGSSPAHAGYNGSPNLTLSYTPPAPAAAAASVSGATGSPSSSTLPRWTLPAAIGAGLLLLAMN